MAKQSVLLKTSRIVHLQHRPRLKLVTECMLQDRGDLTGPIYVAERPIDLEPDIFVAVRQCQRIALDGQAGI